MNDSTREIVSRVYFLPRTKVKHFSKVPLVVFDMRDLIFSYKYARYYAHSDKLKAIFHNYRNTES